PVRVEVVPALKRALRVARPLVEIADHVVDAVAVGAAFVSTGGRERPGELVEARVVHLLRPKRIRGRQKARVVLQDRASRAIVAPPRDARRTVSELVLVG